jgi:hypothetical protein
LTDDATTLYSIAETTNEQPVLMKVVQNRSVNAEALAIIAKRTTEPQILDAILRLTGKLQPFVFQAIVSNTLVSESTMSDVVGLTGDVPTLTSIAHKTKAPQILVNVLKKSKDANVHRAVLGNQLVDTAALTVIAIDTTAPQLLDDILRHTQKLQPPVFQAIVNNEQISEPTRARVVALTDDISTLTFIARQTKQSDLLVQVAQKTIDTGVHCAILSNQHVNPAALEIIAKNTTDPQLLDAILQQPKDRLGRSVFQAIIKNNAVSDLILSQIVSLTNDITVLRLINTHSQKRERTQKALDSSLLIPLEKIDALLIQFKTETTRLIEKGKGNPSYESVAAEAQILSTSITKSYQEFFSKPAIDEASIKTLNTQIEDALNRAKPAFATHRHWWGRLHSIARQILGILACITILPMLGVAVFSKKGVVTTFFKTPPTDASVKLQHFEEQWKIDHSELSAAHNKQKPK